MANKTEKVWTAKRISILVVMGLAAIVLIVITIAPGFMTKLQSEQQSQASDQTANVCGSWQDPNPVAETAPKFTKPTLPVNKLQTTDIKVGTGEVVKSGDCVRARYIGWLADTGKAFDGNFTNKFQHVGADEFSLSQVIKGWQQGVPGMKVGGERRMVIPADLGYGKQGNPPTIPANSALVFVVQIEAINHNATTALPTG
jgi:FKBP-type peptidyl-prolyl cis-trans isomerase